MTEQGERVLVAIPAYNEEGSIGSVLADLAAHHPIEHVVVIDDGSWDATSEIARAAGVRVLRHAVNLGVGAAMGTAFAFAARHDYDALIQLDADGQHRPEFLGLLTSELHRSDIVIGSRFASAGGYVKTTFARRTTQRVIAWVVSAYAGTRLTDVTSGFRLAGRRAIDLFADHYPVEWLGDTVESIVLASRQGLTVREISVAMNERLAGLPSQSLVRSLLYTARIFFILVLAGIRSAPRSVARRRRREQKL